MKIYFTQKDDLKMISGKYGKIKKSHMKVFLNHLQIEKGLNLEVMDLSL